MKLWIGYDKREDIAYRVCKASVERYFPQARMDKLSLDHPEIARVYTRKFTTDHGQMIDVVTGQPFSTEFAYSRFLIPHLEGYQGWAAYCDCDFLWLDDIRRLYDLADDRFAVLVVPHDHVPKEARKMDGIKQTRYFRKNWSSLMLINCAHPSNARLTPEKINTQPGSWLHGFQWLDEGDIGTLPEECNWLLGKDKPISPTTHYRKSPKILAYHYTEGGPWFPGYENCPHAEEWRAAERML